MLNMRSFRGRGCRAVSISRDEGGTWSEPVDVPELIEPSCQASILRYGAPDGALGPLLFSNPASGSRARVNMTVRLSDDEGQTWPVARCLDEGPVAYSCLESLPDGRVGCLYENGAERPYEKISLARFSVEWVRGE